MASTESLWLVLVADWKRGQSNRSGCPRFLTATNTCAVVTEALLGRVQICGLIRVTQDCFADTEGLDRLVALACHSKWLSTSARHLFASLVPHP